MKKNFQMTHTPRYYLNMYYAQTLIKENIQDEDIKHLLFGIVLFFGLLLIYTFNIIAISSLIYLTLLPISFFHYQKLKKQNQNEKIQDSDDDLEDVL